MFGKGKKIVSLAYKEKLLAEIAHYERRIDEALHKRTQTSFEDDSSDEDRNSNPYKLNIRQSGFELKHQEASLSDRASMTLELAMLTIMQSEVNVMVTPPEVRRPVNEDGIWLEVAAECKIDLVSFTITFYAHKPHRRFAPTRYRNVTVDLVKPAHQKELSQSVLPKQNRPNLALQVLQSYATAFRSRRTTLLELAEKYEEKLRMEAMPEGGYRVKFLDLLQVDWTLENLWSPIVPFCHRMKFEVEYMPKDYIHTIGKLYKQFKDPSLETSERTLILAKIFDTCLQAQGPAREVQDSFESDPETAGRLHERRTTIDHEPDIPNVASPQKPKGKENKAQNRKTTMEPPKTIPKKAKKDAKKSKDKNVNAKDVAKNRKGVKRGIENDVGNNAKKTRTDEGLVNSKSKPGVNGGKDGIEDNEDTGTINKAQKKVSARNVKEADIVDIGASENDAMKKGSDKSVKTKAGSGEPKDTKQLKKRKKEDEVGTSSKKSTMTSAAKNNDKDITSSKSTDVENNISSKKDSENIAKTKKVASKQGTKKSCKNAASKDENSVSGVVISINKKSKVKAQNIAVSGHTGTGSDHTETANKGNSKTISNEVVAKVKASTVQDKNKEEILSKNATQNGTKPVNVDGKVSKTSEGLEKGKNDMSKLAASKDTNTAKPKEVTKQVVKKTVGNEITEKNSNKETNVTEIGKVTDKGKGDKEKLTGNAKTSNINKNKETMQNQTAGQKSDQNKNNKEKTNRNETTQKGQKNINDKNKATFTKPDQINTNNLNLVKKSINIPTTKLSTVNQIKLADKLKTKIPMMKSKLKLSALSQKVLPNNMGKISRAPSGVEKTKIPKSLPVFKKVAKNLPTRISPRKPASTIKPSSHGFSNK